MLLDPDPLTPLELPPDIVTVIPPACELDAPSFPEFTDVPEFSDVPDIPYVPEFPDIPYVPEELEELEDHPNCEG